jgi:hypothetical protein
MTRHSSIDLALCPCDSAPPLAGSTFVPRADALRVAGMLGLAAFSSVGLAAFTARSVLALGGEFANGAARELHAAHGAAFTLYRVANQLATPAVASLWAPWAARLEGLAACAALGLASAAWIFAFHADAERGD